MPGSKISAAMIAHRGWVVRFKKSILGVTIEKYDLSQASDDTICDFGRWLYGEAKGILPFEQYQLLIQQHKSFHEVAGKIAKMINIREKADAISPLLEELDNQSKQLVNLLMALKKEIDSSLKD